ncbi:MAG: hypothetical protein ACRDIV_13630 [Ktedonobacteraceae bacterium]
MRKVLLLGGLVIAIVSAWLSYVFFGLFGILIWSCVFAFVVIDVIYYYGAKTPLARSFKSQKSRDVPDARIERIVQGPRGWYDLDNRGRGKN